MERLTGWKENGRAYVIGCPEFELPEEANKVLQNLADKHAVIEDILGDTYDLDRLRELLEFDKADKCVLLPVKPNLKQGAKESRCFILLDNGEICEDNVYNVSIGPDNSGNMNTIYSTFDFGDFESQEVGIRIFWDEESASEAALKGENHD